jgi:hypothetical protein
LATAVTLIAFILVLNSLRRVPLFAVNPAAAPPAGWQIVTDARLAYTLALPPRWQWNNAEPHAADTAVSQTIATSPLTAAATATQTLLPDLTYTLAATHTLPTEPPAELLLLVGESAQLAQRPLTSLDLATLATTPDTNTTYNTSFMGQPTAQTLFNVPGPTELIRCQLLLIQDTAVGYTVLICAPFAQFPPLANDFATTLNTFQPLTRK